MNTEELKQNIKGRHEKLFPNATLETQLKKFSEEWKELRFAKCEQAIEELADMLIVSIGLSRFNETAYSMGFEIVRNASRHSIERIYQEAMKKMDINEKKRGWVEKDGYYDHEEGE